MSPCRGCSGSIRKCRALACASAPASWELGAGSQASQKCGPCLPPPTPAPGQKVSSSLQALRALGPAHPLGASPCPPGIPGRVGGVGEVGRVGGVCVPRTEAGPTVAAMAPLGHCSRSPCPGPFPRTLAGSALGASAAGGRREGGRRLAVLLHSLQGLPILLLDPFATTWAGPCQPPQVREHVRKGQPPGRGARPGRDPLDPPALPARP